MHTTVLTRWEHLRSLTTGPKRHRKAVADYLATHPAVLYHGDSWFSTPLYPNLARQSASRVDGVRMIVGKPGAPARELFAAGPAQTFAKRVAALPFDVVCLSAGGNDLLSKRLEQIFSPWMQGGKPKVSAQEAFDHAVAADAFADLRAHYRVMLRALVQAAPALKVVGHSYAPLQRDRIGRKGALTIGNIGLIAILKNDVGPWLFGPMRKVLADVDAAHAFAGHLLEDGFRDGVLLQMTREFPGFFSFADLSGAGLDQPQDWYDEIHPTEAGFAKCADVFNEALVAALPEHKRTKVGTTG